MTGPLEGLKVLSMGRALSGPYATMMLADLGAEVIKIENLNKGDMARGNGPYIEDLSSYFLSVNRGKKSLALNIREKKSKDLILKILKDIDIFVENFRPGITEKMGIDYQAVKNINPKIIYLSISGFGQYGPYSKKPAFDMIAQGMGGTVSITGEPGQTPVRVGFSIGDIGASLFSVSAVLAALYERTKTNLGQHIDIAMLDCQLSLCENACARYFATGEIPKPTGGRHPLITPFQIFPTKTDLIVIATFRNEEWENFCKVIGKASWIKNEKYNTVQKRNANHKEIESLICDVLKTKTRDEWLLVFDNNDVIAGPVNNIEQIVNDQHINSRDMIKNVKHSRLGNLKVVGTPMKFSRTKCEIEKASPDLGEHTIEILKEKAKLSYEEIESLKKNGIIK